MQRRFLREALRLTSIEDGRIRLEWVSASEGTRFGEIVTEFTEQIRSLGPNRVRSSDDDNDMLTELTAVKNLFGTHASRTLIGKEGELVEKGNVYEEKIDIEDYEDMIRQNVTHGYIRNYILASTSSTPRSIKELAKKLRITPQRVLNEISVLLRKNRVAIDSIEGRTPMFLSIVPEDDA